VPVPKLRGANAFFGGLLLVVAALALIAALQRRQQSPAAPPPSPTSARAPLLGPRPANEPKPTLTFEAQGRKSGSDGAFYVLGIVENTSPFAVDKPRITVSLLDAAGKVLATRDGFAESDLLGAGESSAAKILISEAPAHERLTYEVSAPRALYDPGTVAGLAAELEGEPKPNFATWEIAGTVKHQGKVPARRIKVELVIRNASGALIGVESAYADAEVLEPGKSARFVANVMLDERPSKVELSVSARP